jgi:hypothetical protein
MQGSSQSDEEIEQPLGPRDIMDGAATGDWGAVGAGRGTGTSGRKGR